MSHKTRSRVANMTRWAGPDAPETVDARREHVTDELAAHIKRTVDAAPPLSAEQRDRLATLLRSSTTESGGADAA